MSFKYQHGSLHIPVVDDYTQVIICYLVYKFNLEILELAYSELEFNRQPWP